jgi:tetratricopeptide (TPR) repeat protein
LALQQGKTTFAEERFRNALEANPADIDARRLFAEALWARGARAAAVAQIEIANQLAPYDSALTVRAGEMLLGTGNYESALLRADRAIAHNPQLGPAWALRGRIHWSAKRHDLAVADLQRALVHAPGDRDVLLALSEVYLERGQARRCLTTVHQLLDLCPPGTEPQRALYLEGQAFLATGRAADAASSLYAATQRGPSAAELFYALACAEAGMGRTDAAIRAAQSALGEEPAHSGSHALLAELYGTASPATVLRR